MDQGHIHNCCFRTGSDSEQDSGDADDDDDVDGRSVEGGMNSVDAVEATSLWLHQQPGQMLLTDPGSLRWGNSMGVAMAGMAGGGVMGGGFGHPILDAASSDPIVGIDVLDWPRGITPPIDISSLMGSGASAGQVNSSPGLRTSRFISSGGGGGDGGIGGGVPSSGGMMIPLQGVKEEKEEEEEDEAMVPVAAHNGLSDGLLGSGSGGCLITPPLQPPTAMQHPARPRDEFPAIATTTGVPSMVARKGAPFLMDPLGLGRTGSPIPSWAFLDVTPQCLDSLKVNFGIMLRI